MISAKVTANTISMRRSPPPASCCGLRYSAKFRFRSAVTFEFCPVQGQNLGALQFREPLRVLRAPDRIRLGRRDGSAAIAQRPASFRAPRRAGRRLPSRIPSRWARSGRHAAASARAIACSTATRIAPPASFRFRYPRPLCRQPQAPEHFVPQFGERQSQNTLPRIEHHIHRPSQACPESRTASRIRRRMRLRSTDPPSTLPTVNPTRGPLPGPDASCAGARRRKKTVMLPVNCRRPF